MVPVRTRYETTVHHDDSTFEATSVYILACRGRNLYTYAGGKTSNSSENLRASRRSIVPFRLGELFHANRLLTSILRQIPPTACQNGHVMGYREEMKGDWCGF